jgi:hypothetical protein
MAAMKNTTKAMKAAKEPVMKGRAKEVSEVARNKLAKLTVFRDNKKRTSGGLEKSALKKNKQGKVVSKKQSAGRRRAKSRSGLARS